MFDATFDAQIDSNSSSLQWSADAFSSLIGPLLSVHPRNDHHNGSTISSTQRAGDIIDFGDIIDTVAVEDGKHKNKDKEIFASLGIDPSAPRSKQTVQALRLLRKQGRYVAFTLLLFSI